MENRTYTGKKYEIVEEDSISVNDVTLFRVRAIKPFGDVDLGDLGGYIESNKNLDQLGNAWVSGDAWVSGQTDIISVSDIGSERGCLTIHKDNKILVRVNRGCFTGTISEFLDAVESTHSDNVHGKIYKALINVAKIQFCLD